MTKWRYSVKELTDNIDSAQSILNASGTEGWEAIAVWPAPGTNSPGRVYVLLKKPL